MDSPSPVHTARVNLSNISHRLDGHCDWKDLAAKAVEADGTQGFIYRAVRQKHTQN
jgi:hypothetical protein